MSGLARERMAYLGAAVASVLVALTTLLISGDPEVTLLMTSAVITGLICFDVSMNRRLRSFLPWILLSIAPVMKTVPTVWNQLSSSDDSFERFDHTGSLLFGLCILIAVVSLSLSSRTADLPTGWFDTAVIVGSALTAALAGASVAFLYDRDFGSVATARLLETATWFVAGGILAASVVAASRSRQMSGSLVGVLMTTAASAGVLALSAAGTTIEPGWWTVLFAGFTLSAAIPASASLGERDERDRASNASAVVAIIVGIIAAAAAISARSDRASWGPGWALLGLVSLVLFALAMASRPIDDQRDRSGLDLRERWNELDTDDTERAAEAKARALKSLQSAALAVEPERKPSSFAESVRNEPIVPVADETLAASASKASALIDDTSDTSSAVPDHASLAGTKQAAAESRRADNDAPVASPADTARARSTSTSTSSAAPSGAVDQAHFADPSTGLLSAAGLQDALVNAFGVDRPAGHVTLMMFTVRDLDEIEQRHGRLASAAVTREVAERIRTLLPDGTGARFARSAYAILFVGDLSDSAETIQWLAKVLLQLRAPVEQGTVGDKIDVVASMAQCYDRESAAEFVERANQGLARAVRTPEPTFVAMP